MFYYQCQPIHPLNKNNNNLAMLHTDLTPLSEPASSITESQIMSTLNSSIEDLLSKISKVQQEYEIGARVLHPRSLSNIENQYVEAEDSGLKSGWSLGDTLPSHSDSNLPIREEESSKENSIGTHSYRIQGHSSTFKQPNSNLALSLTANSLKEIEQQAYQPYYALKNTKIHSLFDNLSLKQLLCSQIVSDEPQAQCHSQLLLKTREVEQIQISSPSKPHSSSGLCLSDFQMGSSVGSGKFGEVYLCRHKQTGFLFALKKIFKSTIQQYCMEAQFCQEIKLLYMLHHPNVIKLYAHFSDDYHVFLLMEYVEGGQLMAKLGTDEKYVSRVMEPLVDAVDHLHSKGIIHRDIKPQNIVLAFDHTPKLCDFGWAAVCSRGSMRQTFCGTLDYLSPEMKDGGSYACGVDLWSLGVLAYELLTGAAPFKEEMAQWRRKGGKYRWDWAISFPPSVSPLAESFISNLLRENPEERASLHSCRNHFFIKKYRPLASEINRQLQV